MIPSPNARRVSILDLRRFTGTIVANFTAKVDCKNSYIFPRSKLHHCSVSVRWDVPHPGVSRWLLQHNSPKKFTKRWSDLRPDRETVETAMENI